MKHRIKGKKLGRVSKQRTALFKNQLRSLLIHGSIRTTYAKAKAVTPLVEKFCFQAAKGDLSGKRYMYRYLQDRTWVSQVEKAILTAYPDTKSNFTRLVKTGNRLGDDAPMAKLSFTKTIDFSLKKEDKKDIKAKNQPKLPKNEISK